MPAGDVVEVRDPGRDLDPRLGPSGEPVPMYELYLQRGVERSALALSNAEPTLCWSKTGHTGCEQGFHATDRYSLSSPPKTCLRRIQPGGADNVITFGSSLGARNRRS